MFYFIFIDSKDKKASAIQYERTSYWIGNLRRLVGWYCHWCWYYFVAENEEQEEWDGSSPLLHCQKQGRVVAAVCHRLPSPPKGNAKPS